MTLDQAKQLVIGDRVSSEYYDGFDGIVMDTERGGFDVEFKRPGDVGTISHFYRFADLPRLQTLTKVLTKDEARALMDTKPVESEDC